MLGTAYVQYVDSISHVCCTYTGYTQCTQSEFFRETMKTMMILCTGTEADGVFIQEALYVGRACQHCTPSSTISVRSQSVCLSISLSMSVSVCLFLSLSQSLWVSVCHFVSLSLSVCLSLYPSLCVSLLFVL